MNGLYAGDDFSFLFEAWCNDKDTGIGYGLEIYGNTIIGLFDFGSGTYKGTYSFSVSFRYNIIGYNTTHAVSVYYSGVEFEEKCDSLEIHHNIIKNCDRGIYFCHNGTWADAGRFTNIKIWSNLILDVPNSWSDRTEGGVTYGAGFGIAFGGGGSPYANNIYIWNNTILAYAASPGGIGIWIDTEDSANNVYIQNNIICGFVQAPYGTAFGGGSWTGLTAQNNLLYNCGNNNSLLEVGGTIANKTVSGELKRVTANNITLFVSSTDFHLAPGSLAIDAGVNVGLPFNGSAPDIGAYESGTSTTTEHIQGQANGVVTVSGSVKGKGALAGQANGVVTISVSVKGKGTLAGQAIGVVTVSGHIKSKETLAGQADGTGTVSGSIQGKGNLVSQADGVVTISGNIKGKGTLVSQANGVVSVSGSLKGKIPVVGQLSGSAIVYADIRGKTTLSGQINCLAHVTASPLNGMFRYIAGRSEGVASAQLGFIRAKARIRGVVSPWGASAGQNIIMGANEITVIL